MNPKIPKFYDSNIYSKETCLKDAMHIISRFHDKSIYLKEYHSSRSTCNVKLDGQLYCKICILIRQY